MQEEKQLSKKERKALAREEKKRQDAITAAVEDLKSASGIEFTRSLLTGMFIQYSADQGNQVEDQEQLCMLQILNVFNVA